MHKYPRRFANPHWGTDFKYFEIRRPNQYGYWVYEYTEKLSGLVNDQNVESQLNRHWVEIFNHNVNLYIKDMFINWKAKE